MEISSLWGNGGLCRDGIHVFHNVAVAHERRPVEGRLLRGEVAEGVKESTLRRDVERFCADGGAQTTSSVAAWWFIVAIAGDGG